MIKWLSDTRYFFLFAALPVISAYAVGFGSIEVESYLNQPFKAEIPLYALNSASLSDIEVKVADSTAYDASGIDRPHYLSSLVFKVQNGKKGEPCVQITSLTPMQDPYVSLILEAIAPSGRVFREYTILLDPPDDVTTQVTAAKSLPITKDLGVVAHNIPADQDFKDKPLYDISASERVAQKVQNKKVKETSLPSNNQKPLQLVTPRSTKKTSMIDKSVAIDAVQDRLLLIEESLDTMRLKNENLEAKQTELLQQNEALMTLLEAREKEILSLREQPKVEALGAEQALEKMVSMTESKPLSKAETIQKPTLEQTIHTMDQQSMDTHSDWWGALFMLLGSVGASVLGLQWYKRRLSMQHRPFFDLFESNHQLRPFEEHRTTPEEVAEAFSLFKETTKTQPQPPVLVKVEVPQTPSYEVVHHDDAIVVDEEIVYEEVMQKGIDKQEEDTLDQNNIESIQIEEETIAELTEEKIETSDIESFSALDFDSESFATDLHISSKSAQREDVSSFDMSRSYKLSLLPIDAHEDPKVEKDEDSKDLQK